MEKIRYFKMGEGKRRYFDRDYEAVVKAAEAIWSAQASRTNEAVSKLPKKEEEE